MKDIYEFWLKIGRWNTEQAALLFNGMDPSKRGRFVKFPQNIADGHRLNNKEWMREVYRTFAVLEFADNSDWRKFVDISSYDDFYFNRPKKASPSAFISLASYKGIRIPDELNDAYLKQLNSIDEVEERQTYEPSGETEQDITELESSDEGEPSGIGNTLPDSKNLEEAFDPLPLDIIAKMFPLKKDEIENQNRWKYHSGKASQNGLKLARVKAGKGKKLSTFNPYLVGRWVTTIKDGLPPERVNRKLSSNLPSRSVHLKDETFV